MDIAEEKSSFTNPHDLIIEILSRLPVKSVARFRLVSKLWGNMLRRPYFTELFLTRSRLNPRLFFALESVVDEWSDEWTFYSSPQSMYEKSQFATFHMKFDTSAAEDCCGLTSGLLLLSCISISDGDEFKVHVVFNPSTGHYVILPRVIDRHLKAHGFLGFDPVGKQYKVLYVATPSPKNYHKVLTLGTGKPKWRRIHCPFSHVPCLKFHRKGMCIDGVVYYLAREIDKSWYLSIVCFDVRSETFKYIIAQGCSIYDELVNYKGKLGGVCWEWAEGRKCYLSMWVLEDFEKQEWKKYKSTLWDISKEYNPNYFTIAGTTATGEIVLTKIGANESICVYYCNLERNTLQHVEIQVVGNHQVHAFVDYVEDLNAYDKSFIRKTKSISSDIIVKKRPIPQKQQACDNPTA